MLDIPINGKKVDSRGDPLIYVRINKDFKIA